MTAGGLIILIILVVIGVNLVKGTREREAERVREKEREKREDEKRKMEEQEQRRWELNPFLGEITQSVISSIDARISSAKWQCYDSDRIGCDVVSVSCSESDVTVDGATLFSWRKRGYLELKDYQVKAMAKALTDRLKSHYRNEFPIQVIGWRIECDLTQFHPRRQMKRLW